MITMTLYELKNDTATAECMLSKTKQYDANLSCLYLIFGAQVVSRVLLNNLCLSSYVNINGSCILPVNILLVYIIPFSKVLLLQIKLPVLIYY